MPEQNGWIKVTSETLPVEDQWVLGWCEQLHGGGRVMLTKCLIEGDYVEWSYESTQHNVSLFTADPEFWMPLPEGPVAK